MHFTDKHFQQRRGTLGALMALAGLAAGCGAMPSLPGRSPPPPPPPAPPPPVAVARPVPPPPPPVAEPAAPAVPSAPVGSAAAAQALGPAVALPPATAARNWDEFKRNAARRMAQASPRGSYAGKPPPMLFGIPILEIEVGSDGSVRNVSVLRPPANAAAAGTVDIAIEAIRRGGPYGDMSRLPRPWKWTEVFLFDESNKFKPRTLD